MRMFSTRPNRNGFAVSEAFIDNIAANSGKYRVAIASTASEYPLK